MLQLHQIIALLIVSSLSLSAYLLRFLTALGALTAAIIGGVIIIFGGLGHFLLLLLFFIVGSLFTKFKYGKKYGNKNNALRSWNNVFGNGAVAMLVLLLAPLLRFNHNLSTAMYIGAISAAFSDTMATEIGMLGRSNPVLITNPRRRVERGASGGITLEGYLGIASAVLILWLGSIIFNRFNRFFDGDNLMLLVLIFLAGFVGATFDSIVGAILQSRYLCRVCGRTVETSMHCGEATSRIGGLRIINNDTVNVLNTLVGALVGYYVYMLYS